MQIEVAPSFAFPVRKTQFGKTSEAPIAIAGEPVGLAFMPVASERFEIRPRLRLDRKSTIAFIGNVPCHSSRVFDDAVAAPFELQRQLLTAGLTMRPPSSTCTWSGTT